MACACISFISPHLTCECVCVWWSVFVYFLFKCTIVQHSGECVYLSVFFDAGGGGGIVIERILQTCGVWGVREQRMEKERERRKKHSCELVSTVFVIRLRSMCSSQPCIYSTSLLASVLVHWG